MRATVRGGDDEAAREAKDALARARSRSRDTGDRFVDLYVWVFTIVLLTIWVLSFARETFVGRTCEASEVGGGCVLQQHPWPVAVAVACLGLGGLLLAVGAAGPVSAERAVARWLLGATADRAVLLRGPLGGMLVASGTGGVALGLLLSIAAQGGGLEPVPLAAGAGLGALAGALVPLVLLAPQAAEPGGRSPARRTAVALSLLGLGLLSAVVLAGEQLASPPSSVPGAGTGLGIGLAVGLAVVGVLAGAWLLVRSPQRLEDLSDAQLARGREVVDAVADSAMMLDASHLSGLQRRRADQRRGRHPSKPLRARGALVFLVADARQLRRRWRSVLLTFLALPAVLVAGEGFGYGAAVLLGAVVAAWAGRQAGQGLRVWLGSAGLRRSARTSEWKVTLALTLAPTLACALVAVPAVLLVGGPWWGGLHLAVAALAATMRAADPMPAELGVVVSTPAGAVPTGLIHTLLHGPDVALALAMALILVGEPWVLVGSVAALGWQVARDRA